MAMDCSAAILIQHLKTCKTFKNKVYRISPTASAKSSVEAFIGHNLQRYDYLQQKTQTVKVAKSGSGDAVSCILI